MGVWQIRQGCYRWNPTLQVKQNSRAITCRQRSHWYGFSPLCTRLWRSRWYFWMKRISHTSHSNGFSPARGRNQCFGVYVSLLLKGPRHETCLLPNATKGELCNSQSLMQLHSVSVGPQQVFLVDCLQNCGRNSYCCFAQLLFSYELVGPS